MEPNAPSLFVKLALRLTVASVVLVLLLLGILGWRLNTQIDTLHEQTLTRQAQDIARHLSLRDGAMVLDLPADFAASYARAARAGLAGFAVLADNGKLVGAPEGADQPLDPDFTSLRDGEREFFPVPADEGHDAMSGVAIGTTVDGVPVTVQVAQGTAHGDVLLDTMFADFVGDHGWIILVFIGVLIATSFATVRGTLRPVREASELAAQIKSGQTGARLAVEGMPREILPLVEAVNRAFERLEHGIEVQRAFTADAAHQLRTPLAILNAQIDRIEDRCLARRIKDDVGVLSRIVGQLLHAAQAEMLTLPDNATADLVDISRGVATFLAPIAVEAGVTIDLIGAEEGPVMVHGHAEALGHAVRNLVENAIKHTAIGTAVEIVVARPATLHVIDHGPGIPARDRASVVKRFWRADHSTSGAGLGLAIVAHIAEAHDAQLEIDDAPDDGSGRRGAMFTLRLHPAETM